MIANPAIALPGGVPPGFTLNDLRVSETIEKEPLPTSKLTLAGMGLGAVLVIGAFIWVDPMHLFTPTTPTEASAPAPVSVPAAGPVRPTERQELIAPLAPVPETKSVEVPIVTAPVVRAPQVPARVVQPRAASIKPESRAIPVDKTNTAVPRASPMELTAPPMLLTKPEEQTDTPIVPKVGDDTKNAPKPAATNEPAPVTE